MITKEFRRKRLIFKELEKEYDPLMNPKITKVNWEIFCDEVNESLAKRKKKDCKELAKTVAFAGLWLIVAIVLIVTPAGHFDSYWFPWGPLFILGIMCGIVFLTIVYASISIALNQRKSGVDKIPFDFAVNDSKRNLATTPLSLLVERGQSWWAPFLLKITIYNEDDREEQNAPPSYNSHSQDSSDTVAIEITDHNINVENSDATVIEMDETLPNCNEAE